ncbi:transcription initiation protein [Schumannella luteola]|uniref:Transcription initiation protein n=1 Tax=Schumannella luteola TaxID=472059 RepID=A0A852Y773_9MICO|nr:transcription initiation protein [Schumannella luteola]NYG97732.1 hypothetical protein [Schumannella luteola]TPX01401.1 transcription initiation protein [Schumannella luteola]
MTHYLISFPGSAMQIAEEDFPTVVEESHAAVAAAREAGVLVFAGGLDEASLLVRVAADGSEQLGAYPQTGSLAGGFTVIDVPTREDAVAWAARIAAACRCDQELRVFADGSAT